MEFLFFWSLVMNKQGSYVKTITEVGIFAALGYVFDELQGVISKGLFTAGGSIGFAMIAVLIIGLRRGFLPALLTGLIIGSLDICTGAYILNPMQALLDYIFPYAFVSLAVFLTPWYKKSNNKVVPLIVIATVGGIMKFFSHFFAGVFFWNDASQFAWGLNSLDAFTYSFVYNIAYIGPSIILCALLLIVIQKKAPIILETGVEDKVIEKEKINIQPLLINIAFIGISLAFFVIYFIHYLKSIAPYDGGFDADGDSLFIMVISFIWSVICVGGMIRIIKKKENSTMQLFQFTLISFSSFIYGLARLIKMYVKNKDTTFYWEWVIAASIVVVAFITATVLSHKSTKKELTSK